MYKKSITAENLEEFYYLYESVKPAELPEKIKQVCAYLRDGYKYAANVQDDSCQKLDITTHTDMIHTLYQCTADMLSDTGRGIFIILDDGTKVNMEPFFDFMDSLDDLNDTIDNLKEMERVLENYLHDANVRQFKDCKKVIGEISLLLEQLQMKMVMA